MVQEHQKNSNNKTGTQSATLFILSLVPPLLNSTQLEFENWGVGMNNNRKEKSSRSPLYLGQDQKSSKIQSPSPSLISSSLYFDVPAPSWQWLWRNQITIARAKGRETSRPVNEAKVHDLFFPLSLHPATAWSSRWQSKLTKAPAFWPKKQRGTPGNQKLLENGRKIQAQESKPINS